MALLNYYLQSILAFSLLALSSPAYSQPSPDTPSPEVKGFQVDCMRPKDLNDANFCEQQRSAKAAEEAATFSGLQARWAEMQLYAGLAQAGGLFVSLVLTGIATIAAVRAAKAGSASAQAAMNATHTSRAWMVGNGYDLGQFKGNLEGTPVKQGLSIHLKWRNASSTPAFSAHVFRDFRIVPMKRPMATTPVPTFDFTVGNNKDHTATIGPGDTVYAQTITLNDAQTQQIIDQTSAIFVYSRVSYREVYNPTVERVSEFCCIAHCEGWVLNPRGQKVLDVHLQPAGTQNTVS